MDKNILVLIGVVEFSFTVSNADYNKFLNASGGKGVTAAYNFLASTVDNKQVAKLKGLIVDKENQPIATTVLEVTQIIAEEMGDGLPAVVKQRKSSTNSVSEMDTSSS